MCENVKEDSCLHLSNSSGPSASLIQYSFPQRWDIDGYCIVMQIWWNNLSGSIFVLSVVSKTMPIIMFAEANSGFLNFTLRENLHIVFVHNRTSD